MSAPMTALGGALVRDPDTATWRWSDGTPAHEVVDLTLRDVAPNFRCATYGSGCVVEIPRRWRSAGHWPRGVVDPDAAEAIDRLLRVHGQPARIYAEGLAEMRDDHRLTRDGYVVPIDAWDAAMLQVCGASWAKADEAAILARAAEVRS